MRLRRLLRRERSAFHQGPEEHTPIKAVYICADQPVTIIFRLRQGGGPYICFSRGFRCDSSMPGTRFREGVQVDAGDVESSRR